MTQTTLSVDDTSDVIDALRQRFPKIVGPRKDDIVMPPPTVRKRFALAEQADVVLVLARRTPLTPTVWLNWHSEWGKRRI
jgi:4-hydroxy-3-methylbut-2-enyl diphosphate reductase